MVPKVDLNEHFNEILRRIELFIYQEWQLCPEYSFSKDLLAVLFERAIATKSIISLRLIILS